MAWMAVDEIREEFNKRIELEFHRRSSVFRNQLVEGVVDVLDIRMKYKEK